MIQQTSLMAYLNNVMPKLSERQKSVLEAIEEIEPCTNKEIARHLGWEINSVTPRCQELRKKRLVRKFGETKDTSGRKAITWSTAEYAEY